MTTKRKQDSAQFKFRVALAAVKEEKTLSQLASEYGVHPGQISQWKRQLLSEGAEVFDRNGSHQAQAQAAVQTELYEQIGRLKMELEWLKKKLPHSVEEKRKLIEPEHPHLSVRRQCELVGLNRASFYLVAAQETSENLYLMRLIDEQYLQTPFYGSRKMTAHLRRAGHRVNRKRIQRLMRLMGLEAIYPKPQTTTLSPEHKVYPYLLRNLRVVAPNHVWCADITYLPLPTGFVYLVAIMDWYSRFVLTWQLSNTLDGHFCLEALHCALTRTKPAIFNTDQGVQFTAHPFTGCLEGAGVTVSMDGRGRALDNIFIERLWRSLKYEDIYIYEYATVKALETGLHRYFTRYNYERPHQSLRNQTPAEWYHAPPA